MDKLAAPDPPGPPDVIEHDGQRTTGRWNIGAPDRDGWQQQALLVVSFAPGRGYITMVTTVESRVVGGVTEERGPKIPQVIIGKHEATRFHRSELHTEFENGYNELLECFKEGSGLVTDCFTKQTS